MRCTSCYRVERDPWDKSPCPGCAACVAEECERVLACFSRITAEWAPAAVDKAILVWAFGDAPECLRALSNNGGDEDWLVYIRPGVYKPDWVPRWIEVMESGDNPDRFDLPDGSVVFIGSHA